MIQKGYKQTYMVAIGFLVFFVFSFWMRHELTPTTDTKDMFWPLIFRGIGLGLLFIPITTLSLSSLSGKGIGEGAAFTGMMRQLGGSFGIAIVTTFISRFNQEHRVILVSRLDTTKTMVQDRITALQLGFQSKGFSFNESLQKAYKVLDFQVMKQSSILTYMDIFMYLGVLFLICIPFILFVKDGKTKINPNEMAH